jgi:hypothetical protein
MFLRRLIHERSGRLLGFVAAVIILTVSFAVSSDPVSGLAKNQRYGLLN